MQNVAASYGARAGSKNVCELPRQLPCLIRPAVETDLHYPTEQISFLHDEIRHALLTGGAAVLRDFGIEDILQFKQVVQDFSRANPWSYAGGASPRSALADGVYTSTDYPPEMPLSLHNELSYCAEYPRTLYFFCAIEPVDGGETTIGDSRRILAGIPREISDLFKSKGILYVRNLACDKRSPYSWQSAFETDDPKIVESICRRQRADFEWKQDGSLRVSFVGPATTVHPETGEETWFNQAEGFHSGGMQNLAGPSSPRLEAYFGDGTRIPEECLREIRAVVARETILHPWRRGDIMIVDNILTAHGRMPYSGPRKIAVAMV